MLDPTSRAASLRVGVLLMGTAVQMVDASAVDLFGMCTPGYLKALSGSLHVSEDALAKAQNFEIIYISESGAGTHFPMTAGAKLLITHSLEDAGKLDYLIVPGQETEYQPTHAELDFIRTKFNEVRALFPICTGVFPVLRSGVLKGKRATGPRMFIPRLKQLAPDVQWTEKRWEVDVEEKVWSSGVMTNGLDSIAAYIRKTFPPGVAEIVCTTADVGERAQLYETEA
ncbi:hypothetical protein M0805_003471 [Coniferiporia weirii]|nr:hypothetical protein M0805_003471 [Coniferiporia weirii]